MSTQTPQVYTAINAVQTAMSKEGIAKNRRNTQGSGYNFRGVDDVMNAHVTTCDDTPSPRETYHATIAYQSPQGTTTALAAAPIRIDN